MKNSSTVVLQAEIQFARDDTRTGLTVASCETHAGIDLSLADHVHDEVAHLGQYPLTLAQAIQLRDFLNRHIDGLALQKAVSLAVRASDDPQQLAAEEILPAKGPEARIIRYEPSADLLTLDTHTAYFEVEVEVQETDGSRRTHTTQFGYAMYHGRGEAYCFELAKSMAIDAGKDHSTSEQAAP